MSKGSTRRPASVPPETEADNWARTFGGEAKGGAARTCQFCGSARMVDMGREFGQCLACLKITRFPGYGQ